jgi:selenium metabolism protein YedF
MKEEILDLRGLACPMPVVRTREKLAAFAGGTLVIRVDGPIPRDNVCRTLGHAGCRVTAEEPEGPGFRLTVSVPTQAGTQAASAPDPECGRPTAPAGAPAVLITGDTIGRGSDELGSLLMKAFCNTLETLPVKPALIACMQSGVRLVVEGADTLPALQRAEKAGIRILVCGTCLDYFKLKDRVRTGTVSNMYDITDALIRAGSVITL